MITIFNQDEYRFFNVKKKKKKERKGRMYRRLKD